MTGNWEIDDIHGGLIVAQKTASGSFLIPFMISWKDQHPETLWGVVDMRDGMFVNYGTKEQLAEMLTSGSYVLAHKFIGKHDTVSRLENRLGLPVVSITNVGQL